MRFFRDAAIACAAALLTAGLAEGVLRLAGAHYESSLFEADAERGYSLRPNAVGWRTLENPVRLDINSEGMRDREHTVERPPHTLRIAVLGASEVESISVPFEDTFVSVMEKDLQEVLHKGDRHVEMMNFGVEAYVPSQCYLTLKNHVWKYSPQVVILAISGYEILRNTRALYYGPTHGTPFYELKDGHLVPDALTLSTPPPDPRRVRLRNKLAHWMNQSTLFALLNEAARTKFPDFVKGMKASLFGWRKSDKKIWPPEDYFKTWPFQPNLPDVQQTWAIAEAFMNEMNQECRHHHAEFWVVMLDEEEQTYPDVARRAEFERRLGIPSLFESNKRLARYCALHHIRCFDLAAPLAYYTAAHQVEIRGAPGHPLGSGHWNEMGHEIAGTMLTEMLLSKSTTVKKFDSVYPSDSTVVRKKHELPLLASKAY